MRRLALICIQMRVPQLVAIGIVATIAAGCDQLKPRADACPSGLAGAPSPESGGIIEAVGGQERLTGSITSVLVECLPSRHEPGQADRGWRRASTDYEVAVTATVEYKISDQDFASSDANVIFEALSATGVVLGSTKAFFRFTKNGSSGQISAKIVGLSEEEVRRVTSVHARWEDGS